MMEKVIDLASITDYIHYENAVDAILDEDFKIKTARRIAGALRIEDVKNRKKALQILQRHTSGEDLKRIGWALDYYGFMYDYIKGTAIKERYFERSKEFGQTNRNKTPVKKEESTKPIRQYLKIFVSRNDGHHR